MFALCPGNQLIFSIFKPTTFGFVGQRAASEAGHIANTNVVRNVFMDRLFFLIILALFSLDTFASKDPWDKDQSKWTPLMKLAHSSDTLKIKELIKAGISVNLQNKDGWCNWQITMPSFR